MTQIFIVSGTSWTVLGDWSNTNTVEVIGGGGVGRMVILATPVLAAVVAGTLRLQIFPVFPVA
jgi:hypothetical protein